ncbi:MAG: ammonium transporter [Planctomycetaceae bacterium]|nr:ammonium transporter [Planctomycetaceae bacterium]
MALCLLATIVALGAVVPAVSAWDDEAAVTDSVEYEPTAAEEAEIEKGGEAASEMAVGEATVDDKIAVLEAEMAENDYVINTLFMMLCAVLVILMQPGFAMLEVGLNSQKNTVNILFKNVMDLSVGVILFLFIGWGVMYPGDFNIVDGILGYAGPFVAGDSQDLEYGFSNSVDFLFQVAFAATAATIVSGAVAGRMKFVAYLIFSALLTGLIYPISGAWKWGEGFLHDAGFQDFAGSVVVHAVGGFAGLAGAIVLGPRIGRFVQGKSNALPGHNIAFAAIGVFLLWIGWYGFNPGSQLTYSGVGNAEATTYIALTTTLAAAAGAVCAMFFGWALFKKPDVTMALNGVLAGLVSITANCDQVTQPHALLIGGIGGVLVVLGIMLLDKLKIDDPVGAWPVHGLCGIWGGIATGIFGFNLPEITTFASDGVESLVTLTRAGYIWVQLYSTAIICAWAFGTMFALFMGLKALKLLRVSKEDEEKGLDLSEHGMRAYGDNLS